MFILIYILQDGNRGTFEHRGVEPIAEDIGSSKQAPVSISLFLYLSIFESHVREDQIVHG
jgi:hypothetical protein